MIIEKDEIQFKKGKILGLIVLRTLPIFWNIWYHKCLDTSRRRSRRYDVLIQQQCLSLLLSSSNRKSHGFVGRVGPSTSRDAVCRLSASSAATFSAPYSYAKISYKGKSWRRENSIVVWVIEVLLFSSSLLAAPSVPPSSTDWQDCLPTPCSQTIPHNLHYKAQSFTRS